MIINLRKPITAVTFAALMIAVSAPIYAESTTTGRTTTTVTGSTTTTGSLPVWNNESQYWSKQYPTTTYYSTSRNYSVYEPAYQYGYEMYERNNGRPYNELSENELRTGWEQARRNSTLTWEQAQNASRDSYNRLYNMNNR